MCVEVPVFKSHQSFGFFCAQTGSCLGAGSAMGSVGPGPHSQASSTYRAVFWGIALITLPTHELLQLLALVNTRITFLKLFFLIFNFYNCIFPMGFLTWEIWVALPRESKLQQSCTTEPTVHAGCFSVSIIHRTPTGLRDL